MELIQSNKRQETGLARRNEQPWAVAIRETYGELPAFAAKFSPAVQKYCAHNIAKAVEDDLPTFGRLIATYGEKGMAGLISTHMTEAILRMGEDRDADPYDVQFISEAICESDRFRTLRFPSIFGFFHLLKCGEFDIYGKVTPRKILEAFRKYAIEQQAKENRLAYEKECREADEERDRWAREAREQSGPSPLQDWEAWAAQHGIQDKDWVSYINREAREHRERQAFWKNLADLIARFRSIMVFIAEWQNQQKTPPGAHRRPK